MMEMRRRYFLLLNNVYCNWRSARTNNLFNINFKTLCTSYGRFSSSGSGNPRKRRVPPPAVLTLTDNAIKRISYLISRQQDPSILGIRIGVKSRGCSGKSYTMQYVKEVQKLDEVIKQNGVTVYVDPKAVMFILGTEVDFVSDHLKSEFVFINPNAKGECGCGESFNV